MSYATYLSNKLASQQKVVTVRKPTDASMITQKRRFEANTIFFADGQGVGSLAMDTSRPDGTPLLQHASTSFKKGTTRPTDASSYTAYRGSQGIRDDAAYSGIVQKLLICAPEIEIDGSKYKTSSDYLRSKGCELSSHQPHTASELGGPLFVDNTIRLSAMVPDMMGDGCCKDSTVAANHNHSPGLPIHRQNFAVTQHTFMAAPPGFQNQGVGGARIGAYYTPKSGYVENKHGNDLNVNPRRTPGPWVYTPGAPAHLKINRPTLFRIKP